MPSPFCILYVLGDVLDDRELRFVGTAKTIEGAWRRVKALAESDPGQYAIYNQRTGERVAIETGCGNAAKGILSASPPRANSWHRSFGKTLFSNRSRKALESCSKRPVAAS